jgi:hypothetical protein
VEVPWRQALAVLRLLVSNEDHHSQPNQGHLP